MTVKTEIMAKIPIVIPSSERNVLSLFPRRDPKANEKLSNINLVKSIFAELKSKDTTFLNLKISCAFLKMITVLPEK
jgi:hypothetical protein